MTLGNYKPKRKFHSVKGLRPLYSKKVYWSKTMDIIAQYGAIVFGNI